jgi:hypothetical protein
VQAYPDGTGQGLEGALLEHRRILVAWCPRAEGTTRIP